MDSIERNGIAEPMIVRPREGDTYEIIAGHRRDYCAKAVGLETRPVIVREYTDEQADILVVDYNINREDLLPSEKARAYKLKLDAMKRQAGRPANNSRQLGENFQGKFSVQILAEQADPRPLENYYNDVEKAAANEREEPLDAEIGIRETGVPVGLLNRRIEPGYVLENGIVLLESERDENGHYVGGAGMDGMYLRTGDLYKPCMDAQGNVRAFRQVQPEKEKTPVAADDRASVKAKLEGLKKPTPQRKPKQRDRGAR